ncbi:hypothetical protein [Dactylosporangium sp. CA-233914]|uniref:hypothetical protein n=1 Tax=Dactylosporangium sp. CA-233914 TaxID=3239934 RepID=UPI003D8D8FCA
MTTPFSPPGTPEYVQAGAAFQLAAPVDLARAFTARSTTSSAPSPPRAGRAGRSG